MSDPAIFALQSRLKQLGHDPGPLDGLPGLKTAGALQSFINAAGLPLSAVLDRGRLSVEVRAMKPATPGNLPAIPWITEFRKVYGWHEVRDRDRLSRWLRSDGKTLGDPARLPWCGDAMDTALALALPKEPRPGDLGKNPYWALNWSFLGESLPVPFYGAITAFVRPEGGHVGVLVGQDEAHFYVLGGNQGDSISIVRIAKERARAHRWPSTYPNPRILLPTLAPGEIPFSTNEA